MIDVLRQKATSTTTTGQARHRGAVTGLSRTALGTIGTVTFGTFAPSGVVNWLAAEIDGVENQGCDSVRMRIGTDTALYYIDENDSLRIKPVTDESSWSDQYSSPLSLASLDLWTEPTLRVVVALVSTNCDRNPTIQGLTVAMDLPMWEGSVAQATRRVVAITASIRPTLVHRETLTAPQSVWLLGEPHSEHGHVLTSLVGASVDGVVRSATLADGTVTLAGITPKTGQEVVIAVRYHPHSVVRRMADTRILHKLPAFLIDDLVRGGGLNGSMPLLNVNGIEVSRRMVDLRIQVRGAAVRQADALAMRAAMQETFGGTELITLDSGRTMGAATMEVVEVTPGGDNSMPVASGVVHCPMTEYTGYRRVSAARRGSAGAYILPTNTITIGNPDSGLDQTLSSDSYSVCAE